VTGADWSGRRLHFIGIGGAGLASATAHRTAEPGWDWSRPIRTGQPPGRGAACSSALVSSSETTSVMSSQRSAISQRCSVARVNDRAVRTAARSVPGVRVAMRGNPGRGAAAVSPVGDVSHGQVAPAAALISGRALIVSHRPVAEGEPGGYPCILRQVHAHHAIAYA